MLLDSAGPRIDLGGAISNWPPAGLHTTVNSPLVTVDQPVFFTNIVICLSSWYLTILHMGILRGKTF